MLSLLILLIMYISLLNAGPVACGAVCTTCCSAQWFWIPAFIPACLVSCVPHCVPAPIPPVPTPMDIGCVCQISAMAALVLPTP